MTMRTILPIGGEAGLQERSDYCTIISPFMTIQWPGKVQR